MTTALILMSRPPQLLLVVAVATLGVVVARARGAEPDLGVVIVGMIALLAIAASIHLANEYADHETDARTIRTPFSGGSGALQRYPLDRGIAIQAARILAVVGCVLAAGGWIAVGVPGTAVSLALVGLVVGWAYSVGPWPLAWHGWGEVANAFLGGMLLPLYGLTLAGGAIDGFAVLAFGPFTTLVFANLLATTWPDRHADASVGKSTLATRWPKRRLRVAYAGSLVLGAGLLVASAGLIGPPGIVIVAATIVPLAVVGAWTYVRLENPLATVVAMCWLLAATTAAWLLG